MHWTVVSIGRTSTELTFSQSNGERICWHIQGVSKSNVQLAGFGSRISLCLFLRWCPLAPNSRPDSPGPIKSVLPPSYSAVLLQGFNAQQRCNIPTPYPYLQLRIATQPAYTLPGYELIVWYIHSHRTAMFSKSNC
jgi:hypothetical protein